MGLRAGMPAIADATAIGMFVEPHVTRCKKSRGEPRANERIEAPGAPDGNVAA